MDIKTKKKTRQEIVDNLNKPNFGELVRMKEENLTWEQLRSKLKIPIYK